MKDKSNNSLSTLVNNGIENFNNFWKPFEDRFKELDKEMFFDTFGKVKDSFLTNSANFANELKDILKDVKDTKKAFTYIVDFDKDKEKIDYKIEDVDFGKKLCVTIKSNDGSSKTINYISIPKDCDLKNMLVKYNENEKKEVFTIPKYKHYYSHKNKKFKNNNKVNK